YMVISKHIALIHAKHNHVNKSVGFSLIHFEKGVNFNHQQYDPVHIIITLATEQPQIHLNALRQFSELVMDDKARQTLFSGHLPDIMSCIYKVSQH
ncbi:PTS sugar transporter subunit IIA, partial [Staphylococcus succinus]